MTAAQSLRRPWIRVAFACALAIGAGQRVAHAQIDERMKEVKRACAAGEVDKAVRLLAELYAETNDVTAIYNQARCYQGNGQPDRAASRFREYLRKATSLPARDRAEVERFIREADAEAAALRAAPAPRPPAPGPPGYPPASAPPDYPPGYRPSAPPAPPPTTATSAANVPVPTYPNYPPAPPGARASGPTITDEGKPPRRKKGMLIAGLATFGGSYLLSAGYGIDLMDKGCTDCDSTGSFFLVPVIGPWLAVANASRDEDKSSAVLLGLAQATGLTLTIIGISKYRSSAPNAQRAAGVTPVAIGFAPTRGGAFGALSARF